MLLDQTLQCRYVHDEGVRDVDVGNGSLAAREKLIGSTEYSSGTAAPWLGV